jgi:phosphate:Na+ symporter
MGTTIKIFLGSIGGTHDQKRMALANFLMNFITSVIVAIFLQFFFSIVTDWIKVKDPYMSLAFFQSIVNLLSILLFYPFVGQIANLTEKIFKKSEGEIDLKYIHAKSADKADNKLQLAENEILHLLRLVMEYNLNRISPSKKSKTNGFREYINLLFKPVSMAEQYKHIKDLHGEILDFLVEMNNDGISTTENERCAKLIDASRYIITAAKEIKDIVHNLNELDSSANDTLYEIYHKIQLSEIEFYDFLKGIFSSDNGLITQDKILLWQKENKIWQKKSNEQIYKLLDDDVIDNRDGSTLVNVFRSVYSAHKYILKALEQIYFKKK